MNCEEAIKLMDGYLDGELDPITSQRIEEHLRDCRKCEQAYEADTALAHAISTRAHRITRLRLNCVSGFSLLYEMQLAQALSRSAARENHRCSVARGQGGRRLVLSQMPWNWLALAAAIILAAIITCSVLPRLRPPGADQFLATQLIASHVRSLMANHLTDVASSDQHTVKPWLDAKLDFAPPVVDLSS